MALFVLKWNPFFTLNMTVVYDFLVHVFSTYSNSQNDEQRTNSYMYTRDY